jgi:hypothetical protein
MNGKNEGCFLQTMNFGCLIVFAIVGIIAYFVLFVNNDNSNVSNLNTSESEQTQTTVPEEYLQWTYDESQDKMSGGTIKTAKVVSLNEFEFNMPYDGMQRAFLILRTHPRYGHDVILGILKGQFLCGIEDCNVNVRFDDGKTLSFSAVEPADYSSTQLFIRNYNNFLGHLRKSKKVYIEAQFFNEGNQVFEFDVSGLTW